MDLVNQNKFKNILIILLLVVNIISLAIIWIQTEKLSTNAASPNKKGTQESVSLMKEVLNLNDDQTKQLQKLRTDKQDLSKKYNDSLALLKKQLADELFKAKSNRDLVAEKTKMIGELQSKVELVRYNHFNDLLSICTPEQKEKLKPIVEELFGRKPPKVDVIQKQNYVERKKPQNEKVEVKENPLPPSVDEKIEKYSKRLNLTVDQINELQKILSELRQKADRKKPKDLNSEEFEKEKERRRIEEDDAVLKILTEEQRLEFQKMQAKRKR